jgi:hypothetical protein
MRILIAGVVRGSHRGRGAHSQTYRKEIRDLLAKHVPDAEVYTPIESVQDTHQLDYLRSCDIFFDVVRRAANYDVVVAYVPEASLGTGIQMWEAYRNHHVVVTISPLKENHAVKALSDHICPDLKAFRKFVQSGGFAGLVRKAHSPEARRTS